MPKPLLRRDEVVGGNLAAVDWPSRKEAIRRRSALTNAVRTSVDGNAVSLLIEVHFAVRIRHLEERELDGPVFRAELQSVRALVMATF